MPWLPNQPQPILLKPDIMVEHTDPMEKEKKHIEAYKALTRWALSENIQLDLLNSPLFLKALGLIAENGPYHDPQISDLNWKMVISDLYQEAASYVESVTQSWGVYGCSLIIDMWEHREMYYVALIAVSLKGTILLKSICSRKLPSTKIIEELTLGAVQGIGFENVVQILLPQGNWLSEFDAEVYRSKGVCVRRSCKSTFADVIFGLHTTEIFEDVYEPCRKIFEFLHSKLTDPSLIKMRTNYQVLQLHCISEFKRRYMALKLVLKEEEALRHMFASEETSIRDPNVSEVKRIVEGTVFWEQGRRIMTSVEYLSSLLRMIDGYTSNLGCMSHGYSRAREATEVFTGEKGSNSFLLGRAYHMMVEAMDCSSYKMGAHLNPRLFYDSEVKLNEGEIEELDCAIVLTVPAGKRQELGKELGYYRALEKNIFGDMAIKSIHSLHPRVWWERWGGAVPNLQRVAIKIHSQPCSFKEPGELRSIIQAVHAEEQYLDPIEWQEEELLLMKVHSCLVEMTMRNKEADSRPFFWDEIENFLDGSYMKGFDGVGKVQ